MIKKGTQVSGWSNFRSGQFRSGPISEEYRSNSVQERPNSGVGKCRSGPIPEWIIFGSGQRGIELHRSGPILPDRANSGVYQLRCGPIPSWAIFYTGSQWIWDGYDNSRTWGPKKKATNHKLDRFQLDGHFSPIGYLLSAHHLPLEFFTYKFEMCQSYRNQKKSTHEIGIGT